MKWKLIVGFVVLAAGLSLGWLIAKILTSPGALLFILAALAGGYLLMCCVYILRTLLR